MNLKKQRKIVAEKINGWVEVNGWWCDPSTPGDLGSRVSGQVHCRVIHYNPDLDDSLLGLGQLWELKARLRELGYSSNFFWDHAANTFSYKINSPTELGNYGMYGTWYPVWKTVGDGESKLSEGAALLEAASKLAKELK